MGIKKKLGLGVASAALGISLIGGGTWAAFNDVETLSARYAAGTLDLSVEHKISTLVNLSNLKPGDVFEKEFTLKNIGSLAIKDVLLKLGYSEFQDADGGSADADAKEFLKQFKISILSMDKLDGTNKLVEREEIVKAKNLYDFYVDTNKTEPDGRVSVVTKFGNEYDGLPVDPVNTGNLKFIIEFIDDPDKDEETGLYVQNKYQGNSIQLDFNFEAIQWNGLTINANHVDGNGVITKNREANSENSTEEEVDPGDEDDNNTPDPEADKITYTAELISYKYENHNLGKHNPSHTDLVATAEFTVSKGNTVIETITVTETKHDVKRNQSYTINFIATSKIDPSKTYNKEITVPIN